MFSFSRASVALAPRVAALLNVVCMVKFDPILLQVSFSMRSEQNVRAESPKPPSRAPVHKGSRCGSYHWTKMKESEKDSQPVNQLTRQMGKKQGRVEVWKRMWQLVMPLLEHRFCHGGCKSVFVLSRVEKIIALIKYKME